MTTCTPGSRAASVVGVTPTARTALGCRSSISASSGALTAAALSSSGACAAVAAFAAAATVVRRSAATTTTGAERSSRLVNATVSVSGAVLASTDTAGEGRRVCTAGGSPPVPASPIWPWRFAASRWVGVAEQAAIAIVAAHTSAATDPARRA